jgi:photosystem II stability/assembly factor-like uncharacterized protein
LQKEIELTFHRLYFFLFIFSFLISSCIKHENVSFQSHSVPTHDEITSIYFSNPLEGIAVGGNTWTRGIVGRTADGGKTWKIDSLFDKEIFCSTYLDNGTLLAMGIEFNLYALSASAINIHKINHQGNFRFIRGVSAYDENHIIAVHGLGNGKIEKFGIHSDSTRTVLEINRDLNAIQCLDSLHWIACGYGIVLRSTDAGEHWDTLDITGDHFVDITWLPPNTIFLLGAGGTVLKSVDLGIHFNEIKSGGIIDKSAPLRCIHFKNTQEGIIAGEDGLIMFTRDGGNQWSILDGLPLFDVKDIFYDGKQYWLCGSAGKIISFEL